MNRIALACAALALAVPPAPAEDRVDFQRDVRPILSNRCFKCHGPGLRQGGLRLDQREAALKRNRIVPGNPNDSILIHRLQAKDSARMPPAEAGDHLSANEIAKLKAWIAQGAEYTPHWSYLPPRAVPPPALKDLSRARNPIDHYLLAKLEANGIRPSPEAEKPTLIRRLYLDLIGLLPPPADVDAFLADTRPNAYERLVDRLMASPHFGERQARHWLDLARYADSNGYTGDGERTIWPWRDWVIMAINANMPFDQFTIEQLAGDLLPSPTRDQLVATGFHRNTGEIEEGGSDQEQFRVERTVDRTNTTGTVWLGLTVACAQCHDHKYDAISHKEYYQLYAFFNSAQETTHSLITPQQEARQTELRTALEAARQRGDKTKPSAEVQHLEQQVRQHEGRMVKTLILKERDSPKATHVHLRGDFLAKGEPVEPGTLASLPPLQSSGKRANRLDLAKWLVSAKNPLTARVVVNRLWQQYFGKGLVATENDFGMQGALPTHPELLDWLALEFVRSGWDVKHLHRLIVTSSAYRQSSNARPDLRDKDPLNTLVARQVRLRLEAEILRDVALSASGMLTAHLGGPGVYPPQPEEVFAFTQITKRWPESKGPDRYRRGMYTFIWRQSQHPLLTTFDGPDAQTSCTRRNRSNTPLQALHLANDPAFVELADALGRRIVREGPKDDAGKLTLAYRLCLARWPLPAERQRLVTYLKELRPAKPEAVWTAVARVLLNVDEFVTRE